MTVLTSPRSRVTKTLGGSDAVTLLSCYVFLLMIVPSSLVVGSFGAAGAPSALFAGALLCWYLVLRQNSAFQLDRGKQPMRLAAILFGCSIVATYVSANRSAMSLLQQNAADRGLIVVAGWVAVLCAERDAA